MLNQVMFIGNLVKDVEARKAGEYDLYSFTVAVNGAKEKDVSYFDCIAWGAKGKAIQQYAGKGSKVCILGALHTRTFEDSNKVTRKVYEVLVTNCEFITLKSPGTKEDTKTPTPTPESLPFDFPNG